MRWGGCVKLPTPICGARDLADLRGYGLEADEKAYIYRLG